MNTLDAMIRIAVDAHAGQVDKAGDPYILHPLAVMLDSSLSTEIERAIAVGHDLLEDTYITASALLELGIAKEIVEAIKSVTKKVAKAISTSYGEPTSIPLVERSSWPMFATT